jgi:hypothetical protein
VSKRVRPRSVVHELQELPIHVVHQPVDGKLLELALKANLAVYDASYLSLAQERGLPIALQQAAETAGVAVRITHSRRPSARRWQASGIRVEG